VDGVYKSETLSFALPSSLESLIHHLPDYFVLYRTMNHSHGQLILFRIWTSAAGMLFDQWASYVHASSRSASHVK
jgi:hypothetical protein